MTDEQILSTYRLVDDPDLSKTNRRLAKIGLKIQLMEWEHIRLTIIFEATRDSPRPEKIIEGYRSLEALCLSEGHA